MECVNGEVGLTKKLMSTYCNEVEPHYGRLYIKTNEELDKVLSIADFKDKDVLTVLSSSDQLLHIQALQPNSVDTFDVNKLTKYLYYLKKWYLLKHHEIFTGFYDKPKVIESFTMIDPTNEDELVALNFWDRLMYNSTTTELNSMFYSQYLGYEHDYDINQLYEFYSKYILNFKLFNIFDICDVKKKYDIIVLSNIMEFINENSLIQDNLYRMLNPGGEVICSNVSTFSIEEHDPIELAKMDLRFDYVGGVIAFDKVTNSDYQVCYKYVRK